MSLDVRAALHDHQTKALDKMHNGCILAGDVGSGKTHTAIAYALLKEPGRDIYVITTAKKRDSADWEKTAASLAVPIDKIKVDSWNNISKYEEVRNAIFIFDEQRLVGTGAWVKSFYKIAKLNRWVLLSATPGDNWLDYVPVFIANGFYANITEFRNRHVIYSRYSKFPKVQRYVDEGILIRRRALLLVEMPMVRHTTRHIHHIYADYDVGLFEKVWKKRWHVYEERPILDAGELFRVGRKVVNTDSSRLEAVRELMEKHDRLIVFYNFDYELEMLRSLANTVSGSKAPTGSLRGTSTATRSDSSEKKRLSTVPAGTVSVIEPQSSTNGTSSERSLLLKSEKSHTPALATSEERLATSAKTSDALIGTIWEEGWSEDSMIESTSLSSGFESSQRLSTSSSSLGKSGGSSTSTAEGSSPLNSTPVSDPGSFAIAEWNGHKHEPIPETDRWIYLVQYTSGSEGWNCISTNAVIFYSLTYSYKQFYQCQGRIDRMNTPFEDLHYYVLMTKSIVDKAVWRALSMKKDFNVGAWRK